MRRKNGSVRLVAVLTLVALGVGCSVFRPLVSQLIPPFAVNRINPEFDLPPTPVIVFYVDGLNKDVFEEMAQSGELPMLKRYLLDRAATVENAVSSVPSLTYANATSMICGVHPSHHGVVANKWFDRNRLTFRNYESKETMAKANTDVRVPTIYEILDDKLTAVIGMHVNRGAKLHFVVTAGDGGLPAGVAWSAGYQEEVDAIMAQHLAELGREARCLGHWPDFTMVYFPGPDDVAHFKGAGSRNYRASLRALDCSLGKMLRALDEGGVLEPMTLVLTADHGMEDVARANYLDVACFVTQTTGIPAYRSEADIDEDVTYLDVDNDVSLQRRVRTFRDVPIVAAHSGERHAALHLRPGAVWSERPTLEQALWFHRPGDGGTAGPEESLPRLLVRHPGVEFVAVRDGEDGVELHGKNGVARIERDRSSLEHAYRYQVVSGGDPLFHADPSPPAIADGGFHGSREWLDATAALTHPDAVAQLGEAFDDRRAGDLMLFAAPCWDFSPKYVGGHGGLERGEMRIPLYFAGPRIAPGTKVFAARQVDLVPTILDLMGVGDRTSRLCKMDGKSIAPQLLGESAPASR